MGRMPCPFLTPLQNQVGHHHHHHRHMLILHYSEDNLFFFRAQLFVICLFFVVLDESGPDDGAAKANPSLTREKDLVVNISDLDNIFDEDDEELGVRHQC